MKIKTLTYKKKKIDQHRPFSDAVLRNLEEWFRVELTYSSNSIEGNTLTRRETALVVEKGLTVGGKTLVEHLEATNHAQAIDWVLVQVKRSPHDLCERDILDLHALILKGIDDSHAGYYRRVPVRISGSPVVLPNPLKVPDKMGDFVHWLSNAQDLHPIEVAAEAHYRLVTIHPFIDGNGRTARLLMNMILLMNGYPAAIIRPSDRLAYIASLEQAQLGGPKDAYLKIIHQAVNRSLNIYLKAFDGKTEMHVDEKGLLKIGEVAQQAGLANSTIRHWTQHGLLEVAELTESGYQLYAVETLKRIENIQELKRKRFTLEEIHGQLTSES